MDLAVTAMLLLQLRFPMNVLVNKKFNRFSGNGSGDCATICSVRDFCYSHLVPAEPLELTRCCTVPQDKEDTVQANARWALNHFI